MKITDLYNIKTKELNDELIIKCIKEATNDYENGAIIECREALKQVVYAINLWEVNE